MRREKLFELLVIHAAFLSDVFFFNYFISVSCIVVAAEFAEFGEMGCGVWGMELRSLGLDWILKKKREGELVLGPIGALKGTCSFFAFLTVAIQWHAKEIVLRSSLGKVCASCIIISFAFNS